MAALRSQLRRAVLVWFYCNRNSSVYVRELAAILQVDSTNLSRELNRLGRLGFLRAQLHGNKLRYAIYCRHKDTPDVLDSLGRLIANSPDWQRLFSSQNPKTQ